MMGNMPIIDPPPSVLSGTGGAFSMAAELQAIACFTDDGILHVSASHKTSHHVLGYMERLNRNGAVFQLKEVSLGDIHRLYKSQSASEHAIATKEEDTTRRQDEVVQIMREASELGSSDVHFIVKDLFCLILFRVHGELQRMHQYSRDHGLSLCATLYNSMCDVAEPVFNPNRGQDARVSVDYLGRCGLIGARVATRPSDVGLAMVLRLLKPRQSEMTLDDLGYLKEQIDLIRSMGRRTSGINIISGATGSGKSTTLELLLGQLAKSHEYKLNIITVEDPPEYKIPGVVQTPIICDKDDHEAVSREWARSITNLMRLDPDVMMIGEIRDTGSATAAIRAAMTGHGVWASLHANDPISILERLRDIGVDINQITDPATVTGLINQSLVRRLCPHCKRPYAEHRSTVDPDLADRIDRTCIASQVYLAGDGCEHCRGSGVVGRFVVAEVLVPTLGFMTTYRAEGKAAARAYWVKKMHGITRCAHLIRRINEGHVDPRHGERSVGPLDDDLITLGD